MTIPSDATVFTEPMDPEDQIDFEADLSPILAEGSIIASYTLALLPTATAAGVSIMNSGGHVSALIDGATAIRFWLDVAPGNREDPAFDNAGLQVGIVVTITTNSTPARRRQRTFVATVRQR